MHQLSSVRHWLCHIRTSQNRAPAHQSLYEAGNRANLLIISFEVNQNTTSEPTETCILRIPKVLVPVGSAIVSQASVKTESACAVPSSLFSCCWIPAWDPPAVLLSVVAAWPFSAVVWLLCCARIGLLYLIHLWRSWFRRGSLFRSGIRGARGFFIRARRSRSCAYGLHSNTIAGRRAADLLIQVIDDCRRAGNCFFLQVGLAYLGRWRNVRMLLEVAGQLWLPALLCLGWLLPLCSPPVLPP